MKPLKTNAEIRALRGETDEMRARIAEQRELLEAEVALHELREAAGVSQAELAARLEVSRPRVSAIEKGGEDLRLSTFMRYVEGLGGEVHLRAVVLGREYTIRNGTVQRADAVVEDA